MEKITYKITDKNGIHARPAGLLVKEAGKFKSVITITNMSNDNKSEANKLFGVMGLNVKCGDEVNVIIDGEDEEKAYEEMSRFFKENL